MICLWVALCVGDAVAPGKNQQAHSADELFNFLSSRRFLRLIAIYGRNPTLMDTSSEIGRSGY